MKFWTSYSIFKTNIEVTEFRRFEIFMKKAAYCPRNGPIFLKNYKINYQKIQATQTTKTHSD